MSFLVRPPHIVQPLLPPKRVPPAWVPFLEQCGGSKQRELGEALIQCVGLKPDDIVSSDCDPLTGSFELQLRQVKMGWAKAVSDEAPGGIIVQMGFKPGQTAPVTVAGTVDGSDITFDSGLSFFVKTSVDRLSIANRLLLKVVMALPGWLREPIVRATLTEYDPFEGTVESHVRVTQLRTDGETVTQRFSLFGSRAFKPTSKSYPFDLLADSWKTGEPLTSWHEWRQVLRGHYPALV